MVEFTLEAVITPIVIIALAAILWNFSKQQANFKKDIQNLYIQLAELKVSLKEDIHADVGNQANKFEGIQKQISEVRSDLKEQGSRVTANDTKIKVIDEKLDKIDQRFDKHTEFFTVWIQRVEDRIRDIIKFLMVVFAGGKRITSGTGDLDAF